MQHEVLRILAFLILAVAFYVPVLRWGRMSQTQRYIAMFALGAAFVFYQYHPTRTACETETAVTCGGE